MMDMGMNLTQRMELIQESPYTSARYLYEGSPRVTIEVILRRTCLPVPAALVHREELESILQDKYAGTIGGMFFITRETPEEYHPFAAFHELAEHAAPRGFDVTGLEKHYQAVSIELAYAKTILNEERFQTYLDWRKNVERSKFFQLEHEELIAGLGERLGEIFQSIPEYLTYRNRQLVKLIEKE